MGLFSYEALDKSGKQIKGIVEAASDQAILERLRGMGYYPLRIIPHRIKASQVDLAALPGLAHIFHRIKFRHKVAFTRQLATLVDAGMPILRSLYILEEQVESVLFKKRIHRMAADIEGGASLSEAMAKHPKLFDKLYVNMVRAGEIGGVLEAVLNKVAEFMEKRSSIVSKVRSALAYPVVVGVVATILVSFILLRIVPKFEAIYTQLGAELPALTQWLISASYVIVYKTPYVIMGVIAILLIYTGVRRTREGRYLIDSIVLRLPVFGEIWKKAAIARFSGTLSTLINAGVPILQSLDIVRETSGNAVLARCVEKIYQNVKDGESINAPMRQYANVFPPLVAHMIAVGEETGAVDLMLTKVAEAYEREVDDTVDALTSIIEPLLIVFLGVTIGVVVVALYLPLFSIVKNL